VQFFNGAQAKLLPMSTSTTFTEFDYKTVVNMFDYGFVVECSKPI